jgi:hypothetical protein
MYAGRTIYLIQRAVYSERYDAFLTPEPNTGLPVHACARVEDAERRRQELEEEARRVVCPFLWGPPQEHSSLDARKLARHFRGLGLRRLPQTFDWQSVSDWQCWWDEHAEELTPEQRRGIWAALDKLHFYQVVAVELEG